jgi:hypothetical protein
MTRVLNPADLASVDQLVEMSETIDRETSQFGVVKATASNCQIPPWQS